MVNNERMVDCSNWIAVIDYKEGEISIEGGIPTDEDIKKWNTDIGKPIELFDGEKTINDLPLLRHPTEADLQLAQRICIEKTRQDKEVFEKGDNLRSEGKFKEAERIQTQWVDIPRGKKEQRLAMVLNVSYKEVKHLTSMMYHYYWMYFGKPL